MKESLIELLKLATSRWELSWIRLQFSSAEAQLFSFLCFQMNLLAVNRKLYFVYTSQWYWKLCLQPSKRSTSSRLTNKVKSNKIKLVHTDFLVRKSSNVTLYITVLLRSRKWEILLNRLSLKFIYHEKGGGLDEAKPMSQNTEFLVSSKETV